MSIRLRRLANDYEDLKRYVADQDRVLIKNAVGDPPEKYQIEFRLNGLEMKNGEVEVRSSHLVEIVLPLEYPNGEPKCRMLTPVFHPNISPQVICHTDHWAAGDSLVDIVVRIGEMISYQNYNIKSPRNGEAARWAEEHMGRFPVDPVGLSWVKPQPDGEVPGRSEGTTVPPDSGSSAARTIAEEETVGPEAGGAGPAAASQDFTCANCGSKGPAALSYECDRRHVVCPDCVMACGACGKRLCVLCPFFQCSSCKAVLCEACTVFCPSCGRPFCQAHCGACPSCRTGPGPDRGASANGTASSLDPLARCDHCGQAIEYWNAEFCPFCGTKLRS